MSRTESATTDLAEFIVTSRSCSAKKKHRPTDAHTDEPACAAPLHDGDWTRKTARQTIFYGCCNNQECFGGGSQ